MATSVTAATWNIDPDHSAANFSIKHMTIAHVAGSFPAVSGNVVFNDSGANPFTLTVDIDPASISTGVAKRDGHLKSPDFFDVEKYPKMGFVSEKVVEKADGVYEVTGILTMRGVAKPVTVKLTGLEDDVKDPWGNIRKGAQITGVIDRTEFGIAYNAVLETGAKMIGETTNIVVDLEFIGK